jgi:DNA-directed RNA polymerase specialized sigma24 family protein
MAETEDFAALMRRVRGGDAAAADELWRRYEPLLRREVRLRLRDPRLRQRFDENDVCQSVMASFFVRVTAGEFELDGPDQLRGLLAQMGRHKLASQARRHQAGRRDARRAAPMPAAENSPVGDGPSPSQVVVWRELLDRFRAGLSDEERQLADRRAQGQAWADIAAELGGTADGRRVQLNRAVARVSRELGLDDESE